MTTGARAGFGVYLHVPFCAHRCDYCAFATWTDRDHLIDRYLRAVATEIERAVADGSLPPATSVFVGGGTPTRVPPDRLAGLLGRIPTVEGAEITVECNPDDVSVDLLRTYREAGVNRISMGVQSLDPLVLAGLGRTHDPAHVDAAVAAVRAVGFDSFNLDLIMGGAGESVASWERTLAGALELDPPHVSAYGLTVEAGTPLADEPDRHPDDDDQATKYLLADEVLTASGRPWYEVSNWAEPGHECHHNQLYWDQGDYLGLGCAAHSHRAGRRWWNVRTPDRYIEKIEAGEPALSAEEILDDETRELEGLQLALRTREGVPAASVPDDPALVGLLEPDGDHMVLSPRGRLLANEVAIRLRPVRTASTA